MSDKRKSIINIVPTICQLMGISKPELSTSEIIEPLVNYAFEIINLNKIEKCLIFAPDAVGEITYQNYQEYFNGIPDYAPLSLKLNSVYKPVTPVCFASMFTGALPEAHGITKYEKPVLKVDTIFDQLIYENKNPAIVAVENSSIDLIFRRREMAYYSEKYDREVIERTIDLMKENKNDFILSYNQEYDDSIHDTIPFSERSINALKNQNENFLTLAKYFDQYWIDYNRLIMYTPDHGCHIDKETGKGDHGENIPEDMNVIHFCGIAKSGEILFKK
jgi:hypothetical protein